MVFYKDFSLTDDQINGIKKRNAIQSISKYIKENGVEPNNVSSYYTATDDEIEFDRRLYYAMYLLKNSNLMPNDEIWYTTTDGNIISPKLTGISISSNTYTNGKGIIKLGSDLESIPSSAFNGLSKLLTVTLPSSVTSIGDYAFAYCDKLTAATISNGVTSIGQYAFAYCTNMASIVIPDTVSSIGYAAFRNCIGLTSIVIPDIVTNLAAYTFTMCSSLETVIIGKSVANIGKSVFYNCSKLASITYNGTSAEWNNIVKDSTWEANILATEVQCTDGVVEI